MRPPGPTVGGLEMPWGSLEHMRTANPEFVNFTGVPRGQNRVATAYRERALRGATSAPRRDDGLTGPEPARADQRVEPAAAARLAAAHRRLLIRAGRTRTDAGPRAWGPLEDRGTETPGLVEEAEDLPTRVLPLGLLVVHDPV